MYYRDTESCLRHKFKHRFMVHLFLLANERSPMRTTSAIKLGCVLMYEALDGKGSDNINCKECIFHEGKRSYFSYCIMIFVSVFAGNVFCISIFHDHSFLNRLPSNHSQFFFSNSIFFSRNSNRWF